MSERLDDNLRIDRRDGVDWIVCAHCGHPISSDRRNYLGALARIEGDPSLAGPKVRSDANIYLDRAVVFRQYCCPNCLIAVSTQVLPDNHPDLVMATLSPGTATPRS